MSFGDPSPSRAYDLSLLGILLLLLFNAFFLMASVQPGPLALYTAASFTFFFSTMIWIPIHKSNRIPNPISEFPPSLSKIEVRVSTSVTTRALDIGVRKYIILSKNAFRSDANRLRAIIWHEAAHINNKDSFIFNFVLAASALYMSITALIVVFILSRIDLIVARVPPFDDHAFFAQTYLVFTIVIVVAIAIVLLVRKLLHEREFRADAFALEHLGDEYRQYIDTLARRASVKSVRTTPIFRRVKTAVSMWFTHPKIHDRFDALTDRLNPASKSTFERSFICAILYVASSMLAYITIFEALNGDQYSSLFIYSNIFAALFSVITLLCVFSFISISILECVKEQKSFRSGFIFCVFFGVIHAAIVKIGEMALDGNWDVTAWTLQTYLGLGFLALRHISSTAFVLFLLWVTRDLGLRYQYSFIRHFLCGTIGFATPFIAWQLLFS